MKCLILAGGRGERLWPLSRKNSPKQFIQIQRNHSVFQETIARNMPFCDEFIIVTSYEYRFLVEMQMKAFQGITYRCIFEEEPKNTTAAITLACFDLQPSEYVFVVAADHLIDTTYPTTDDKMGYQDAILEAKELAAQGFISLFGMKEEVIDSAFGYMMEIEKDGSIGVYCEKPDEEMIKVLSKGTDTLRNLGMFLFKNENYQREMEKNAPERLQECRKVYAKRHKEKNSVIYFADIQQEVTPVSIEKCLIERTSQKKVVLTGFQWDDIGSLEDLSKTDYNTTGVCVLYKSKDTVVINNCDRQSVVVNDIDNLMVVNTADAVYVGKYGESANLKEILKDSHELRPYAEKGTELYHAWGYYEQLMSDVEYSIRRVIIYPGQTIPAHIHQSKSENWTIVKGQALVFLNGNRQKCSVKDNIGIPIGVEHQISNIGEENLILVETAVGNQLRGDNTLLEKNVNLDESQLGIENDPMVKLKPAYKDYLWGGTKLRDVYHKDCDYAVIAESWELSAHPAGQSIVNCGKHKGMSFGDYLDTIGKEAWGWKCSPLQQFPLMIKFIDAKEKLSVQVHPDDEYALQHENEYGKNEMWYVIDSEPGAGLYVGFNRNVSRGEIEESIADQTIMELLNFYPTKPGDVFFIPAGTVHAIGAGNLICEIQQSSNSTYRLYDYNRKDKFGNLRELHIKKALDVLNYNQYILVDKSKRESAGEVILSSCKYFEAVIYEVESVHKVTLNHSMFYSVICIKGSGNLSLGARELSVTAGESVFIPATEGILKITGKLTVILSHI